MANIKIFTKAEQRAFDAPPKINNKERSSAFFINNEISDILSLIRIPVNKIGFMLQLGSFRLTGKFFAPDLYRKQDVLFLCKLLNIDIKYINFNNYKKITRSTHKKKILLLEGWCNLENIEKERLYDIAKRQIEYQKHPKQIMFIMLEYLIHNKIVVPSYYFLSEIISKEYNNFETNLLEIINSNVTDEQIILLDLLILSKNDQKILFINDIKNQSHSLKTQDINKSVQVFREIKKYYIKFEPLISKLNLSDQAIEYHAGWVKKSKLSQIKQLKDKPKFYLYILCFIKHQFFYRTDLLTEIFLKLVKNFENNVNKKTQTETAKNKKEQNNLILSLSKERRDLKKTFESIKKVAFSDNISDESKISKIKKLIGKENNYGFELTDDTLIELENNIQKSNSNYFSHLTNISASLQRKASKILLSLDFNEKNSESELYDAVKYFIEKNGSIDEKAPTNFLNAKEEEEVKRENFNASLYITLLLIKVSNAIKSGKLNLLYSFKYLAVSDYLIPEKHWQKNKNELLNLVSLQKYVDIEALIKNLRIELEEVFRTVNKDYLSNKNQYLSINKSNKFKVTTPKIEKDINESFISKVLMQNGHIPILQLLAEVNKVVNFTKEFKHHLVKNSKSEPNENTLFAGIIGKGCNIGISKLSKISKGLTFDTLRNAVTWYFDLKNIQEATNAIIDYINKLSLANIFCDSLGELHTGSDGQKVNVSVDCILANYFFKYFGKTKGVSVYTFVDEKQSLFYSTVISASEREASYVIDGLLNNKVIKSSIHSTDTHGFTESIFGLTYLLDVSFAPRIKKIGTQRLYAFGTKSKYEKLGYKILPSGSINLKIIKDNWDDILRFIVTIKSNHTTASTIMKRLSSYSKHLPLYKALKEFGKIIKTVFILTYYKDLHLRQKIEKQLNIVELANKFSKAIFFANNQELKEAQKEEQDVIIACRVLIQNAIILWNYLFLSQIIINTKTKQGQNSVIRSIKDSSVISWAHVNLHGEYDFNNYAANDSKFNIAKILDLNV